MSDLTIVTWKWRNTNRHLTHVCTYEADHVNRLARGLERHMSIPYRLVCITDDPRGITECETYPMWLDHSTISSNINSPTWVSCYRRLKLFDPQVTSDIGGSRFASIDLDTVVTGDPASLFTKHADSPFVGYRHKRISRPLVYGGTFWQFDPSNKDMQDIWTKFDPEYAAWCARNFGYRGTDQAWISWCVRNQYPHVGPADGARAFSRHGDNVSGNELPPDTSLVFFYGKTKPWMKWAQDLPWVREEWK
jgi:hypothetical protein